MTKPVQIINDYWLKEVILNGNPNLEKFYKEDLIKMINILKLENKRYKEVINKAIEYLESKRVREKAIIDVDVLQGILKEVEHE